MSGYVTLGGGGDLRSTTISSRNHTATPDGSVSNPSSISIDKDRIAVGLVREGFAMEYRVILGVFNSTLTLVYLLLQLLLCYPGYARRWLGPVVLLIVAPLYHLLWSIRYRGVQLQKLNAYSMHRATGIVIREWSWKSLEIIFQLTCLIIAVTYAVLDLLAIPLAGVVLSFLSLLTFARLVYDLEGIHEASVGVAFNRVIEEAWTSLSACLFIVIVTTACGMLSSHYIAQESSIINGLVVVLVGCVDGVVCITAASSLARAHKKVVDDAERSRLCPNNLSVKNQSLLRDIRLSFKHARKLNETAGLTFWQLLRLIDGCSANYHSGVPTHDIEAGGSLVNNGELVVCDNRILGWEIVMDMVGESRGLPLWRYLTDSWAQERLETVIPSIVPILNAGVAANRGTHSGRGFASPPVMTTRVRRQSPERRVYSKGDGRRKWSGGSNASTLKYGDSCEKGSGEQLRLQQENLVFSAESTTHIESPREKFKGGNKRQQKKSFLGRLREASNQPSLIGVNSPGSATHRPR